MTKLHLSQECKVVLTSKNVIHHISKIKGKKSRDSTDAEKAFRKIQHETLNRASLVAQWLRIHLPMLGHRFKPGSGKIPHAGEQLGPCTTTTEPVCHNY